MDRAVGPAVRQGGQFTLGDADAVVAVVVLELNRDPALVVRARPVVVVVGAPGPLDSATGCSLRRPW